MFGFYFCMLMQHLITLHGTSLLYPVTPGILHDKWGDSLLLAEYSLSGPSSHLYLDYTQAASTSSPILDDETFCASLSLGVGKSEQGNREQMASRKV